jgi:hypothetical protein
MVNLRLRTTDVDYIYIKILLQLGSETFYLSYYDAGFLNFKEYCRANYKHIFQSCNKGSQFYTEII